MRKVLIVDNEAAIRRGLAQCIDWVALDCTVVGQACDGADALEQIPTLHPDILLSDIRMPVMDGMALAEAVSRDYPEIQVIILTGYPDFAYAQRAIAYRVADFVLKPTSAEQLTAAIEKAKANLDAREDQRRLEHKLEQKSDENLRLARSLFLADLLFRDNLSQLFVLNRLTELGLDLNGALVLHICVDAGRKDEIDLEPLVAESRRILCSTFSGTKLDFVSHGENAYWAVVRTETPDQVSAACREAADIIADLTPFSVSIGVSEPCRSPLDLCRAASVSAEAQKFAEYTGQTVVRASDLPRMRQEDIERVTHDLKLLRSAMENHNLDATRDIYAGLFRYIRQAAIPFPEVRPICVFIYNICINALFDLSAAEYMSGAAGLPSVDRLLQENDVDAIERRLEEFLETALARAERSPENMDALIRTIKEYIDQRYAEEISLEKLAGVVHLSPSYLSKLFKRELGENISVYIQNVRIEKAKILLKTTNMKTYEVAEAVGISNPVYFSRMFKKATGQKPKDYKAAGENE